MLSVVNFNFYETINYDELLNNKHNPMITLSIKQLDKHLKPQIKRINKSKLKIGRSAENDIVLDR